jgi:glycosyltransferase involved in cell wall biosynthesis
MEFPLVSVVMPAFNEKRFIMDAVSSAINQTYPNLEVILVDDGSTDPEAIDVFNALEHPRVRKISTLNQGPAMARNAGVMMSKGKYILPLDSDDLISNTYVEKAVLSMESDPSLGIVYSHACFIGDVNAYWDLPEYDPVDFLTANCIFVSGLYRREDWSRVGGYKADMVYGLEDYDFWLSLVGLGRKVLRLPEVHFFYRKHGTSFVNQLNQVNLHHSFKNILQRHEKLYRENTLNLIIRVTELKQRIKEMEMALAKANQLV